MEHDTEIDVPLLNLGRVMVELVIEDCPILACL
jgi:hypothetical protein